MTPPIKRGSCNHEVLFISRLFACVFGNLTAMKMSLTMNQYYTTIYSQAFSPCKKFLAAANNFGKIAIFSISKLLSSDTLLDEHDAEHRYPFYTFSANDGPIYSLETTEKFLISSASGNIQGWAWKDILNKSAKVGWSLQIPQGNGINKQEINTLLLCDKDGSVDLYAGCSDNNVYSFDLEAQKSKRTFSGHTDYVHCLTRTNNDRNEMWSSGEDGLVLTWDVRRGEATNQIEPFKNDLCKRPGHGKWIACVAIDSNDEWMICGGGPQLSMWHLRSMSCMFTFPTVMQSVMCALFHEDTILSAGMSDCVESWSFDGEPNAKIPTSALSIHSLLIQDSPQHKILCASGRSWEINVCSQFKYKDFSLMFV